MNKKHKVSNVEAVERRKHWLDRRKGKERRASGRIQVSSFDCRSGLPRRASDVGGELADGDVWWNKGAIRYE
jgi:hypothetical protein